MLQCPPTLSELLAAGGSVPLAQPLGGQSTLLPGVPRSGAAAEPSFSECSRGCSRLSFRPFKATSFLVSQWSSFGFRSQVHMKHVSGDILIGSIQEIHFCFCEMSQWPSHARDNSSSLAATLFTFVDPVSSPFDLFDYWTVFCCKHLVLCYHWISQTMYRSVNGQTFCLGRESLCSRWELWQMGACQGSRKAEAEIQLVWHGCGKGRWGIQGIQSSITFLSPFWCYPTNLNLLFWCVSRAVLRKWDCFYGVLHTALGSTKASKNVHSQTRAIFPLVPLAQRTSAVMAEPYSHPARYIHSLYTAGSRIGVLWSRALGLQQSCNECPLAVRLFPVQQDLKSDFCSELLVSSHRTRRVIPACGNTVSSDSEWLFIESSCGWIRLEVAVLRYHSDECGVTMRFWFLSENFSIFG